MDLSRQVMITLSFLISLTLLSCSQERPAIEDERLILTQETGAKGGFYFFLFELATGNQPFAIKDVIILDPRNDLELQLPASAKEKIAGSLAVQAFMNSQIVFDDPKMQKDYEAQDFYKEARRMFTRFASAEIKTIMTDYSPLQKFKFTAKKSGTSSLKMNMGQIETSSMQTPL